MNFHPSKHKRILGTRSYAAGCLLTIYLWSFLRDKPFSCSRPTHFNVHPLQLQPVHLIAALITIYTRGAESAEKRLQGIRNEERIVCQVHLYEQAGGRTVANRRW